MIERFIRVTPEFENAYEDSVFEADLIEDIIGSMAEGHMRNYSEDIIELDAVHTTWLPYGIADHGSIFIEDHGYVFKNEISDPKIYHRSDVALELLLSYVYSDAELRPGIIEDLYDMANRPLACIFERLPTRKYAIDDIIFEEGVKFISDSTLVRCTPSTTELNKISSRTRLVRRHLKHLRKKRAAVGVGSVASQH